MHEVLEREEKWAVENDFALPRIEDIAHDAGVDTDTVELSSVYYDTCDYDLRAHGIVVRLRDGEDDAGWQVKLPAANGRLELQWPLSDTPPEEVTRLLAGVTLGKELSNSATSRTTRHRHRVTSGGVLRFEIADDSVRASTGAELLAWREIEVELGPGESTVPKKLRRRLRPAGAKPSTHPSNWRMPPGCRHRQRFRRPRPPSPTISTRRSIKSSSVTSTCAGDSIPFTTPEWQSADSEAPCVSSRTSSAIRRPTSTVS